jgi:hypothetical protein
MKNPCGVQVAAVAVPFPPAKFEKERLLQCDFSTNVTIEIGRKLSISIVNAA